MAHRAAIFPDRRYVIEPLIASGDENIIAAFQIREGVQ
jgi:hypothetical protein